MQQAQRWLWPCALQLDCLQVGDLTRQLAEAQASHTAATADKAESLMEADAKATEQLAAFSKGELQGSLAVPATAAVGMPATSHHMFQSVCPPACIHERP